MKFRRLCMQKKISIFLFFILFHFSFAEGWQDKNSRLTAIDQEIQKLAQQKENYELLKKKIQGENSGYPKIALVLSGGGAKGAAHIGVLRVLEKYQIPLDIIVGTSVGSIVGGMYAIGYSPNEIEKLVLGLQFSKLLNDSKDKALKTVESELGNEKYPLQINMDKQMNLSSPKGILNGQNIYFQLKDIFAPASNIHDFDRFPIPYRAITTNLQSGKEEIIKEGDLSLASFRSMAIPAFISPVEYEGNFYVDGGVVNNFPVDVAIEMGADIIIGVDITASDTEINSDSSIISVIDKISSYNGNKATELHKKLASILISPDVKNHSTVDFSNLESLVLAGEQAAEANAEVLKTLSNPVAFREMKAKRLQQEDFFLPEITVEGNQIISLDRIKSLDPKKKTHRYTKEDLEDWARKIYANSYVDQVQYEIRDHVLHFDIREKKEISIHAGISYNTNYGGSLNLALNVPNFFDNITNNIGAKIELSEYPKIALSNSFSYHFGEKIIYGQGNLFAERNPIFLYDKGDNISTYSQQNLGISLALGTELVQQIQMRYQLSLQDKSSNYVKGSRQKNLFSKHYRLVQNDFELSHDSLNRSLFPSEGSYLEAHAFTRNSIDKKQINIHGADAHAELHIPLHEQLSISGQASFGKMEGKNIPLEELYQIGGTRVFNNHFEFMGAPLSSILARDFWILGAGLQYQLYPNVNLIGKYNYIKYTDFYQKEHSGAGYGIGLGLSVLDSPLIFSVSKRTNYASPVWELSLGYIF